MKGVFKIGTYELSAWLVLNHDPPDQCLLSSWDYRCEPLASVPAWTFLVHDLVILLSHPPKRIQGPSEFLADLFDLCHVLTTYLLLAFELAIPSAFPPTPNLTNTWANHSPRLSHVSLPPGSLQWPTWLSHQWLLQDPVYSLLHSSPHLLRTVCHSRYVTSSLRASPGYFIMIWTLHSRITSNLGSMTPRNEVGEHESWGTKWRGNDRVLEWAGYRIWPCIG
jgi:hypothetical protein